MILEIEPRAVVQSGALRGGGLIEHRVRAPVAPAL
jgi:hypothetical protein